MADVLLWESRKLDKVSESITALRDEDKAGFRAVSSQISQSTSQLNSEVNTSISTVSSQVTLSESASVARQQAILAHLDDHSERDNLNTAKIDEVFQQQVRSMDLNEAGFQAVHSGLIGTTSSNLEEHKTTHAMLRQCQSQFQTLIRGDVTFGTIEQSVRSASTDTGASDPTSLETSVFWSYYHHRMPIGTLTICVKKNREKEFSRQPAPRVGTGSEIAVTFVPPSWLSRVAFNYSIKVTCDLVSSQWYWGANLEPLTVNYNRVFINAIDYVDVEGVRRSFAKGLAKRTDYILGVCGHIIPWYQFMTDMFRPIEFRPFYRLKSGYAAKNMVRRYCLMLDYMMEAGLPGQ